MVQKQQTQPNMPCGCHHECENTTENARPLSIQSTEQLIWHGRMMLSAGWKVEADPESTRMEYRWTSPMRKVEEGLEGQLHYRSQSVNVPSQEAVEDAFKHGDYSFNV